MPYIERRGGWGSKGRAKKTERAEEKRREGKGTLMVSFGTLLKLVASFNIQSGPGCRLNSVDF